MLGFWVALGLVCSHAAGEGAAFCAGPALTLQTRQARQPLCVCEASGSGSLSGCILQSFSLGGGLGPLPPLLVGLMPLCLLALPGPSLWHLLCCSRCSFRSARHSCVSSRHAAAPSTCVLSRTTEHGYAKPKGLVTGLHSGQLKLLLVNN